MGQTSATSKQTFKVTFFPWDSDLGFALPEPIVKSLKIKKNMKARIIVEKNGFRIVPIPG